jgi:hypothetical protein
VREYAGGGRVRARPKKLCHRGDEGGNKKAREPDDRLF